VSQGQACAAIQVRNENACEWFNGHVLILEEVTEEERSVRLEAHAMVKNCLQKQSKDRVFNSGKCEIEAQNLFQKGVRKTYGALQYAGTAHSGLRKSAESCYLSRQMPSREVLPSRRQA
jgi:hypothetical protein